ncbi:MAG TPA: 2Fe-2S iron-sulfur cluster-binding protein [Steroidobacteraceae bacterium]|nr:2Fe-2S iron-sulfur cluster-binding protein [Steroidobacteraceae bacterium]
MLKFHSLRIAELQPDAEDAVAIALEVPPELRSEYVGLPGQHVVLRTELAGEEARRTYSLTNVPGEWPLRIVARVHERGRMSRYLAEQLTVGDRIDVLPPNGSLTPRSAFGAGSGRTYVGFAAGCGITPILSVVKTVLKTDPASRFILFYGNSNTGRAMCLEDLLGLKDQFMQRLALHFVMSREPQEVDLYNGRVDAARVRELARTLFKTDQVAEFFVCGPGDMIDQVSGVLRELNVGAERIHSEHFRDDGGGQADAIAGVDAVSEAQGRDTARVTVLMDGRHRTFIMRMNDDTVLDAAARAGLELPFSCRAGVCSTCRTKVISGEVEMAQNYALEDWELEQGYVLACQSRVKTPTLELDYDEK